MKRLCVGMLIACVLAAGTAVAQGVVIDQTLLTAESALNAADAVDTHRLAAKEWVHTVVWGAGTSAGAVSVEAAESASYAGTWANLCTVTWSAASKADVCNVTGAYKAIRHRISTAVVGGTVTTSIKGVS